MISFGHSELMLIFFVKYISFTMMFETFLVMSLVNFISEKYINHNILVHFNKVCIKGNFSFIIVKHIVVWCRPMHD